jgi:phosphomannomutase
MKPIKFGTDGWRAVVGDDFIPENVEQVIQAFADIYPSLPEAGKPVVVGYDRRNQSKESAELTAAVLAGNNINVLLSETYCATPCVSWNVVHVGAAAGVMITASHNPPSWNGIKFKESYGGAASPDYTQPIEEQIKRNRESGKAIHKAELDSSYITTTNLNEEYFNAIAEWIDIDTIKASGIKVLADPMYGSGSNAYPFFIGDQVTQIHTKADITFGGIHPEPIIPHVNEAIELMKNGDFDICIINDGDADRIGAIDNNGTYVTSHQIYSLILKHVVEEKGWKGKAIKSITTTQMINRICKKFGLELETTPVGFKYISPALKEEGVLIGGEESGGIGIKRHVCERDGILCGLLLCEIVAQKKKSLSTLIEELQQEVGPCYYRRIDHKLDDETVANAKKKLESFRPTELAGRPMKEVTLIDGWHFTRNDDSWLLLRSSGTEPLFRTYAEAQSPEEVDALLDEAKKIIGL